MDLTSLASFHLIAYTRMTQSPYPGNMRSSYPNYYYIMNIHEQYRVKTVASLNFKSTSIFTKHIDSKSNLVRQSFFDFMVYEKK